jgi:VWFA-related protein
MESVRFVAARVAKVYWIGLLLVAFLAPSGPARAQQQPSIKVDVKVVNVLATVRDKHGQLVTNLGKDDFALDEDGHPQTIAYFSKETDLPLTLGLLVDTSESQRRVLDDERSASRSFIDSMLREDRDKAFVIHFDHEVELLQDLTSSRQKLEHALDLVGAPELVRNGGGSGGPDGDDNGGSRRRYAGGGTLLYDAVYLASDEVVKKQPGRKALIVLSDGVDRGSKETLVDAITAAQRADTVVYSILFADEQHMQNPFGGFGGGPGMGRHGGGGGGNRFPQGERPDGKKILDRISRETGGRVFEVSKKQTVDQIYASISEELRSQYNIGYTPAADVASGYHKIHLTTKQKDMTVQARDGYYLDR